MKPVLVSADMITAYGRGIEIAWQGLLAGRSALALADNTDRLHFPGGTEKTPLGLVPGIVPGTPAAWQMIEPMLRDLRAQIPPETLILLATTIGEIEPMEAAVQTDIEQKLISPEAGSESDPSHLLEKVGVLCGINRCGRVISAACASSTIAVAQAASLIASGAESSVLVVACDTVSEFVYAGFASMNALDATGAKPFDQKRQGLNLGEAAAVALFMSEDRAGSERRKSLGTIAGWGITNDASHVTRPDTTGAQLARAANQALERSGFAPEKIAFVSAHGTGTRYNDAMELAAFQSLFAQPRPVFSIKGGVGHTLGAAGLLEVLLSFRALAEGVVPPTIGLSEPEDTAIAWVSKRVVCLTEPRAALTTNSGFGGINAALVLGAASVADAVIPSATRKREESDTALPIGWITQTAYGCVRQGESRTYAGRTTARLVGSVDALFRHKIESFGRFDPVSRMTCYACALALRDAGIGYSQESKLAIGILGVGFTGSLAANRAYFKDYAESGRILARGNLFVYTLPSAPLGEAAIHFGFQGPLFAVIQPDAPFAKGIEIAQALVANGEAPAMIVVQAEADQAVATVISPSGRCTELSQLSVAHPQLSDLIATLEATNPCLGLA